MIFGFADQLPGIIVDSYKNCVLVQINNAGFDSYRDYIKKILVQEFGKVVVFWDQEKERLKEHLPIFEKEISIDHLMIEENNFVLRLDISKAQKVGYYYDHRENRKALNRLLLDFNFTSKNTLDLFSYLGSWAMSSLKAGSEFVTMVDQGDFLSQTEENFKQFKNKFKFLRDDVFKFLDKSIQENQKFDLVISDPPAFAKSLAQASQAKVGYDKLHQKVFRILEPEAIVVFASCTHYYSQQEMSTSIYEAAKRERKKIRLLHQGLQGFDHPISTLNDSSNYIKCLIYYVENL
jgi:23S rRNA (cytosine1962-C5)-methyltransferase